MNVIIPTLNIAYSYRLCETVYECESDKRYGRSPLFGYNYSACVHKVNCVDKLLLICICHALCVCTKERNKFLLFITMIYTQKVHGRFHAHKLMKLQRSEVSIIKLR